ncbi:MAG: hypothetical protein AB8B63_09055 [Granulosicoccus sp.]
MANDNPGRPNLQVSATEVSKLKSDRRKHAAHELDELSAMLDYAKADGDGQVQVLGHSLGGMESA